MGETEHTLIKNRDLIKQIRDFSGMQLGMIYPTDIDGIIEYHNKGYFICELKYGDGELPLGQKIALERLSDDLTKSGKDTILIIAKHETDPRADINMARALVVSYRYHGQWNKPKEIITVREALDKWVMTVS